jgi:hypothetical protein
MKRRSGTRAIFSSILCAQVSGSASTSGGTSRASTEEGAGPTEKQAVTQVALDVDALPIYWFFPQDLFS